MKTGIFRGTIAMTAVLALLTLPFSTSRAKDYSGKSVIPGKSYAFEEEAEIGWTTRAIASVYAGTEATDGRIEFLAPIWSRENTLLFLYPGLGLSSDIDPGFSVGIGARHYLEKYDAIIGANIFYDRYGSPHGNYYNQLGLGAEVMTRLIDFRFNGYIPEEERHLIDSESVVTRLPTAVSYGRPYATGYTIRQPVTTTRTSVTQIFERFEDSMGGYDTEIGVLTPVLQDYCDLRLFVGYYDFDNSFGDDLNGVKARAEARFSPKLAIEAAWYDDEAVAGGNWVFGVRANIPIGGNESIRDAFSGMFRKRSNRMGSSVAKRSRARTLHSYATNTVPLAAFGYAGGGESRVKERMTEEILRQRHVQTSESDFIEDIDKRKTKRVSRTEDVVVDSSVVFVNNAGGEKGAAGTFERPLDTIQGGVDTAGNLFGNHGDVVVAGTGTNYVEDVEDAGSSVRIWGGGRGVPALGGRKFHYGSNPILDGGFRITDVPGFRLNGFTVINGLSSGNSDGVFVADVGRVEILFNAIANTGQDGVDIEFNGNTVGSVLVAGNSVNNAGDDAYDFDIEDSAVVSLVVRHNQGFNAGSDAIEFDIEDDSMVSAVIEGNLFNGTSSEGLEVDQDDDSFASMRISGNQFTDTGGDPLDIDLDDNATGRYQVTRNFFDASSSSDLIEIDADDTATLGAQLFGNTSNVDFQLREQGSSPFTLEDTLGTNTLLDGAMIDLDPNILPLVPFGALGFPPP